MAAGNFNPFSASVHGESTRVAAVHGSTLPTHITAPFGSADQIHRRMLVESSESHMGAMRRCVRRWCGASFCEMANIGTHGCRGHPGAKIDGSRTVGSPDMDGTYECCGHSDISGHPRYSTVGLIGCTPCDHIYDGLTPQFVRPFELYDPGTDALAPPTAKAVVGSRIVQISARVPRRTLAEVSRFDPSYAFADTTHGLFPSMPHRQEPVIIEFGSRPPRDAAPDPREAFPRGRYQAEAPPKFYGGW